MGTISGPEEGGNGRKLDPFVAIARAFSGSDATEEEILHKAADMRRNAQNTPANVRRQRALEALNAIQKMFQESGITEAELQAEGRRIRRQLVRERYGFLKRGPGGFDKEP